MTAIPITPIVGLLIQNFPPHYHHINSSKPDLIIKADIYFSSGGNNFLSLSHCGLAACF